VWAARVTGKSTPSVTNRHDIVTGHLLRPLGTSHQESPGGSHRRAANVRDNKKNLNGERHADINNGVDITEAAPRG